MKYIDFIYSVRYWWSTLVKHAASLANTRAAGWHQCCQSSTSTEAGSLKLNNNY